MTHRLPPPPLWSSLLLTHDHDVPELVSTADRPRSHRSPCAQSSGAAPMAPAACCLIFALEASGLYESVEVVGHGKPTLGTAERSCRLAQRPIMLSTAPTECVLLSQANDLDDAHVRRVDQHDLILKSRVFQRRVSGA